MSALFRVAGVDPPGARPPGAALSWVVAGLALAWLLLVTR